MENEASPQAQAAILAYCQEAMSHLNLIESGIFTYSDLERQLHEMMGPSPPTAEERAKTISESRERFLTALVAIVGPKQLEIDALKEQVSNQQRALHRERDRRKAIESQSISSSTVENPSDDTAAVPSVEIPNHVLIKPEHQPLEEPDQLTPPMVASLIEPEPPIDDDDDSRFSQVGDPTRKTRKRKQAPIEDFSAAKASIAAKDIISRLFAHKSIKDWLTPSESIPATMAIWFSSAKELADHELKPKRGSKIPFVLICRLNTIQSTFTPLGVLYPRHMLMDSASEMSGILENVPLPMELDSTYWVVWKNHPFMSEAYQGAPIGSAELSVPNVFWPKSPLANKVKKYCDSKIPQTPACACQIVTPTPLPQFIITHEGAKSKVVIPLEDVRRRHQVFHEYFNLAAAEILALLDNPQALIDRYGTHVMETTSGL